MKKLYISTVILFVLLIFNTLKAQESYIPKSPNLTDFERYGNIPIKRFVGELDLNIPLLSVPAHNKNIDVSLSYNASGFIPSKSSGIVGSNWSLIAGGVISREIIGEPDDQIGSPETLNGVNGHFEHGYLVGIRRKKEHNANFPSRSQIESFNNNYLYPALDSQSSLFYEYRNKGWNQFKQYEDAYETTPDIFNFNFNGYSGKFFMDEKGEIQVQSNTPNKFTIDLTYLNNQLYYPQCMPSYTSEIRIFDDRGNKYYFGGKGEALEYINNLGMDPRNGSRGTTINAWYLTKVELSNGDIIKYGYLNDKMNIESGDGNDFCVDSQNYFWRHNSGHEDVKKLVELNVHVGDYRVINESDYTLSGGMDGGTVSVTYSTGYGDTYSLTKKTLLEYVEYKNSKIFFSYSTQPNLYDNNINLPHLSTQPIFITFPQAKLDNIKLLYNNKIIKNIDLVYHSISSGNSRRIFLKEIKQSDEKKYSFEYDLENVQLPKPNTCAVDYWGYYNGKLSNDANFSAAVLVPQVEYSNSGDYTYTSDVRESNFNFSKIGQLTKIVYPTKGYSLFDYEPHDYNKRLERRSTNSFIPSLFNVNGIAGGTRIKRIRDFDSNNNEYITDYIYTNNEGQSTGILMDWPRYFLSIRSLTSVTMSSGGWPNNEITIQENTLRGYIQSSTISKNTMEHSPINYSSVKEKITGKGLTEYNYRTYIDAPDSFDGNTIKLTEGTYSPMPIAQNIFILPNDKGFERGKPKKIIQKNELGQTIRMENYYYNENPIKNNLYTATINISNAWAHAKKTYHYNDFLSKKETIDYVGNNELKNSEEYDYNSLGLLSEKRNYFTDNTIVKTKYGYAHEKSKTEMIAANMVGIPLETAVMEKKSSNDPDSKTISKTGVDYEKKTINTKELILPSKSIRYDLSNPSSSTDEVKYTKYNDKGNLLEYVLKPTGEDTNLKGNFVTIIWGYDQTQPIAKIEGAKYSDVSGLISGIVDASNTDAAASPNNDEVAFLTLLNDFRKKSELSNFQITTYTHDPLIGVRSITPPSGITEYYFYDDDNRLEFIKSKDESGNFNIIKEYKHHYKTTYYYNEEQSKTFTRNNCPFGTLPGNVSYTVPANTYSSTINIEDANQKAQNYIDANGQNYANTNATCTPYDCKVTSSVSGIVTVDKSSFKETALNHITGMLEISITEPGTPIWLHGANVGILDGLCRPSSLKIIQFTDESGALWRIKVFPDGNISLTSADNQAELVTLTFEYDKN